VTLHLYAEEFPNLIHLTPPDIVDTRDMWILMPSDLVRVARVRTVWDFIVDITTKRPKASTAGEPRGRKAHKMA
jgi:hypothetical protein